MDKAQDSIKEGYEVTDMNTTIITYFIIGLFVLMFGSAFAIIIIMRGFDESRAPLNTDAVSALATDGQQIPMTPHLQIDPVADRIEIKTANAEQLVKYGTVSDDATMERAHIPVEEAMKRIADGEATYRQAPTAAQLTTSEQ